MYRVLCCLVVASLTIQICCAGASNKTEKEKNKEPEVKEEKLKGFLKLYNFALQHGKLNVSESMKNLSTRVNATLSKATAEKNATEKTNATAVKLPVKATATAVKKPKASGSSETNDGASGDDIKHQSDDNDEGKQGEDGGEEWSDEEYDGSHPDNEYSYHDQYYGGNGKGFEVTNNNGNVQGNGYQYQYDNSPEGSQMMGGQPFGGGQSFGGGFPSTGLGQEFSNGIGGGMGTEDNPTDYNQGFVNYDDGTSQFAGNYDKKTKTHKVKGGKVTKAFVKHHKHSVMKAKKMVAMKKYTIEGQAERRTIMIGNRVCGSKKSTNVHARDEIHIFHGLEGEHEDNLAKRELKTRLENSAALHATDSCCAEHNECPRIVPAKTAKFGYSNDIEYDVMACACDAKFRNCLKNANSYTADAVGHLYFNTLKIPCLTFEHDPTAETKSDQPIPPQDSLNVVSVVPDAETERETVGGAQLVISPRAVPHKEMEVKKEREQEGTLHVKELKQDEPEDSDDEEPEHNKKSKPDKRPDTINPNPSPNNPNPYGTKLKGVPTLPEAYSPKVGISH